MAGIKIVDLPALGRDLISTDLLEVSLNGSGSRKITGQEIMNASKLAVGSTPIVSGTVGRLLFQNTGDVLGQSANLFWDNTNVALQLGTTSTRILNFRPQDTTGTYGNSSSIRGGALNGRLDFFSASNITQLFDNTVVIRSNSGPYIFLSSYISFLLGGSTRLLIAETTGNVLINTTTDAGFKLDVNGTARVKTDLKIETNAGGLTIEGDASGYPTLKINTLRSGTTRRNWMFATEQFNGGDFVLFRSATGGGAANTLVYSIFNNGNIGINTTTDAGFRLDVNGTVRAKSDTYVGYENIAAGSTYIQINPDKFNSKIIFNDFDGGTGTRGGFLEMSTYKSRLVYGSYNYFNIGDSINQFKFYIAPSTGNIVLTNSNTQPTDAGFRLDVNGTARVQGNVTTTGSFIAPSGSSSSYLIGSVNAMDYGDGLRFAYSAGSHKITFFTNGGTSRLQIVDSGSILIGTTTELASSLLTMNSTTRGFLPPRMTNAQRAAIASPAVGLIVYCTDSTEGLYVYKSTGWTFMV